MSEITEMSYEYFEGLSETSFFTQVGDRAFELRITEIERHPQRSRQMADEQRVVVHDATHPFSLFLRSEGELGLSQGIYAFNLSGHEQSISIFIVPLGFERGGMRYEAVFA